MYIYDLNKFGHVCRPRRNLLTKHPVELQL